MELPVNDDLRSICQAIVEEGKTDEEWNEIAAGDWCGRPAGLDVRPVGPGTRGRSASALLPRSRPCHAAGTARVVNHPEEEGRPQRAVVTLLRAVTPD